jgi:hypothetical protein
MKNMDINELKRYIKKLHERNVGAAAYKRIEINNPGEYKSLNCFYYYKCIFVHITKTGGKSISKTLFGNYSGGHKKVEQYIKIFGESAFDRYYKFTFVRNPWDRLYSAYNYFSKGAINFSQDEKWRVEHAFFNKNLAHLKSFERFVIEWMDEKVVEGELVHFIPQHYMITIPEDRNKILVDFVGRYENIEEDFKALCIKLRRPELPLAKINISNPVKNSYIKVYSNEMIDKVSKLYAKDIELFNYTFPA